MTTQYYIVVHYSGELGAVHLWVSSFKNINRTNATTLSQHIWTMKEKGIEFNIQWKLTARAKSNSPLAFAVGKDSEYDELSIDIHRHKATETHTFTSNFHDGCN